MTAIYYDSTTVIVTDLLESDSFREGLKKDFLHNFINDGKDYTFIFVRSSSRYVEQDNGLCQSIVCWAIQQCRSLKILPSSRSLILPVNNQQRALQLCVAKLTKQKCGEFVASASDVLDVWKFLCMTINPELPNKYSDDDVNYCNIKEAIHSYKKFLKSSSTLDHFDLIKLIRDAGLYSNSKQKEAVQNLVFVIEELEGYTQVEQEILKAVLKNAKFYKAIPQIPVLNYKENEFNVSGIELNISRLEDDDNLNSEADIIGEDDDSKCVFEFLLQEASFEEVINENLRTYMGSELSKQPLPAISERYVEQIFLSYFRLLINSRDELALATLLSMPGREISTKDFTKIKYVANKKNMPIYQTIISTVLRLQLGGKGYQPEKSCPIVLHAKSLSEFVNLMHKLQNIIEEEKEGRRAYERILSQIKCTLLRSKGCTIPQKSIEAIFKSYLSFYHRYDVEEIEALKGEDANNISCQTLSVNKALQPALKLLLELCDYAAGQEMNFSVSDIIGEQILTPKTPITNGKKQSPFRVPSVLSLFSSPQSPSTEMQSPLSKGASNSTPLRVRMLRKDGEEENSKANEKTRFQSCCAWASDNISPISKSFWMSAKQLSPITGSTLVAPAPRSKERINWENVFADTSNSKNKEITLDSLPAKIPLETKIQESVVVKKNRKRSLLSDISNLKDQPESKKLQNEKPYKDGTTSLKNIRRLQKNKPLLKGQTAITSFFKR